MSLKRKTTATSDTAATARGRWKLLKMAILNRKPTKNDTLVSVRRFTTFNLVTTELSTVCQDQGTTWYTYRFTDSDTSMEVCHCDSTREDIMFSSDNTGNVCVWPSEEVLAYYCLQNKEMIKGLNVCELGGGMTCLAGVAIACTGLAKHILLTDGNEKSVMNVTKIVEKNQLTHVAESRTLRWDIKHPELKGKYDLVICADCLFFDEFRTHLVETFDELLNAKGEAWIFAPTRGESLTCFVNSAGEKFVTEVCFHYDKEVSDIRRRLFIGGREFFDENLHYPLLVKLTRKYNIS